MKLLRIISLIIIIVMAGSGCSALELNDAAIVAGIGMELEDQQLRVSLQLAQPVLPGQSSSLSAPPFKVVSETGRSFNESLKKIGLSFPREPLLSQANLIILGEKLSQTDLALVADASIRSPNIRKNSVIAVARAASPEEIFNTEVLMESLSATAIPKMLKNQESQIGIYKSVTYDEFLNKLSTPGIEAVAPQVTLFNSSNGKTIKLDGTAVFKGRRMVGYLNSRESRGFRFITPGRIAGGIINIPAPFDDPGMVAIELTRSQTIVKPELQDGKIVMKIEYVGEGNYYEQTSAADIFKLENIPALETLTEQAVKGDIMACISKSQKLGSDIFGWGKLVSSWDPDLWKQAENNWDKIFPGINAEINVKFDIRRSYLTDKSLVLK